MIPQKQLVAKDRALELFLKWNGDKLSAIKDVDGSIQAYADVHPYNVDEPPMNIKWLMDVKNEINKL